MNTIDMIAVDDLFGIEGLDITWYGVIIAVAIAAGVLLACWRAVKMGYTTELIFDMMIVALPLSIVGARLYFVAFEWDYYSQHPGEIIAIWKGGIAIIGAIIGGVLGALIVAKVRKFPFGRLLDIAAPGLILGQAIGRWGNFVNQEAFGLQITNPDLQFFPFGVYIDNQIVGGRAIEGEWYLATFFYECVWNIGILFLLLWYSKKARHDGNVFAMYLIGYGAGRIWIEGLRIQTLQLWGMPVSQLLSGVMIVVGVAYILIMRKRGKPNVDYEGVYLKGWKEKQEGTGQKT